MKDCSYIELGESPEAYKKQKCSEVKRQRPIYTNFY